MLLSAYEIPVLEAFWAWVDNNLEVVLLQSKLGKALKYVKNQRVGLMTYLDDGDCEISNNLAENSIRPFTVGGKTGFLQAVLPVQVPAQLFTRLLKQPKRIT